MIDNLHVINQHNCYFKLYDFILLLFLIKKVEMYTIIRSSTVQSVHCVCIKILYCLDYTVMHVR